MKKLLGLLAVAPMALAACGGDDAVKLSAGEQAFVDNISTKFEVQKSGIAEGQAGHLSITQENIDAADKFYTVDHKDALAIAEFVDQGETPDDTSDDTLSYVALVEYNNAYDSGFNETLLFQINATGTIHSYAFTGDDWATADAADRGNKAAANTAITGWSDIEAITSFANDVSSPTWADTTKGVNDLADALKDAWKTVKPTA